MAWEGSIKAENVLKLLGQPAVLSHLKVGCDVIPSGSVIKYPMNKSLLGTILAIATSVGAIVFLQVPQLQRLKTRSETAPIASIRGDLETEKTRLNLLQTLPAFGFQNLIADWTFLNFLQYFGDSQARERTDYSLSPDYFEVVLKHDPRFLATYTFLSTSSSLYAGLPERSVAITAKGLESLTPTVPQGSYYVWRSRGIDELLFLGDAQAARQSFTTAAEWADASGTPEGRSSAQLSRQTAAFLASNPNSKYAQFFAWTMVLNNAPDDKTRNHAVARIRQMGGSVIPNPDGTYQLRPPTQD